MIAMPVPVRPSTEEKLESLLDRLEGALERTERKIETNLLDSGYQDHTPESKDQPHG